MKFKYKTKVLVEMTQDELDIIIRGLQLIEWQPDITEKEATPVRCMKSDLIAARNQIEVH